MPVPISESSRKFVVWLSSATVLLAPVLSFSVQPITGKFLLPLLGGTATTWLGALLFFQFTVLAGYLIAYGIILLPVRPQVTLIAVFGILSALVVRLPPVVDSGQAGMFSLLFGLVVSLLIPISFLFSIGIILHEWLGVYRGSIPWHLYALSNTGSILALLLYPFFIEAKIDLQVQVTIWRSLLGLLVLLILVLGWYRLKVSEVPLPVAAKEAGSKNGPVVAFWLLLSFLSCLLFMAGTRELTAELGSHPLAWVVPLALYLGAFTITFSGVWKAWMNTVVGVIFVVVLFGYVYAQGLELKELTLESIGLILLVIGTGCVFLNGRLYASRPKASFAGFYVFIALGGILAGLFSTFVAPLIFNRNFELYLAAGIALVILGYVLAGDRRALKLGVPALLFLSMVFILWQDSAKLNDPTNKYQHHFLRSIYSQNILVVSDGRLALNSESTLHGSQFTQPGRQQMATAYYHEKSPLGMVFRYLNETHPASRDMGVIGLGAGTIAAYGREGDSMTFWDIDQEMLDIAQNFFRYIENCPAETSLKLNDGRLGLRSMEKDLDLVFIDAFTGDSVPTHLLTWEAFKELMQAAPDGWLVFHISSRWLDITPILQANLAKANREGVRIFNNTTLEQAITNDFLPCTYIVVPPKEELPPFLDFLRKEPEINSFVREMHKLPTDTFDSIFWTDGKHSVTQLMNWETILKLQKKSGE
jgi:16S rRNA G966 N2-methylase RsmD